MRRAAGLALAALLCTAAVSTAGRPDPLRRRGELRVSWRSPSAAKPHAEVTAVAAGGPGAAAGLQVGDRIATIAGRR